MAAIPETGSAGGLFLLKREFISPLSLVVHAQHGGINRTENLINFICFL